MGLDLDCYNLKAQAEIAKSVWRWYEHGRLDRYPYPFREWVADQQMGTEPKIRSSLIIAEIWHKEFEAHTTPYATFGDWLEAQMQIYNKEIAEQESIWKF